MTGITVIGGDLVDGMVSIAETIPRIEEAYVRLEEGTVQAPPIQHMENREVRGEIDVKSAMILGEKPYATVKAASGFYENAALGLPTGSALVILLDGGTGIPLAIMSGWPLTKLRTGAAAAIGVKYLARPEASRLGLVGCGDIARSAARAISHVRPVKHISLWSPVAEECVACARELKKELGVETTIAADPGAVAADADMIVTATPSREPLLAKDAVRPGTHISAMGSDGPGKQELDAYLLADALLFVDSVEQCRCAGELQHALSEGLLSVDDIAGTIGGLISGSLVGRTTDSEISIFDSTGTAAQDVGIAGLVYERARQRSLGTVIDL